MFDGCWGFQTNSNRMSLKKDPPIPDNADGYNQEHSSFRYVTNFDRGTKILSVHYSVSPVKGALRTGFFFETFLK